MGYFKQSVRQLEKKAYSLLNLTDFIPLSDEEIELKEKCEASLLFFFETFWPVIFGDRVFYRTKPAEAIAAHLEAVNAGLIRKLIISAVSRLGKSVLINVFYPPWTWTTKGKLFSASTKFLCMMYKESITNEMARLHMWICKSSLYRRLWGDEFNLRKDFCNVEKFYNTQGGSRQSISIGGSVTGSGADIRIIDDANKIQDYLNKNAFDKVREWYKSEASTRSENYGQSPQIVTGQRISCFDLPGYLMETDPEWVYLFLPTEFVKSRVCKTVKLCDGKIWKDWRKEEGETVCEKRLPPKEIDSLKAGFGYDKKLIAAVMQQEPEPDTGSVIDPSWFKVWDESFAPPLDYVLQSWDTAFTDDTKNAQSACTTWGAFTHPLTGEKGVILLSVHAGHWGFPELKKKTVELYHCFWETEFEIKHNPSIAVDEVLIEAKASAFSVLSELSFSPLPFVKVDPRKYNPSISGAKGQSKRLRLKLASHFFENGRVYFKKDKEFEKEIPFVLTPGTQQLIKQLKDFPLGLCDILDSMSQALIRLRKLGYLFNTNDPANDLFTRFGFFEKIINY